MKQPFTKFKKHFKPIQLDELYVGLKYIHVTPFLTNSEIRSTEFHIYTLEAKGRFKGETQEQYEEHKRIIKKWVVNGELYSIANPSPKQDDKDKPLELFNKTK